MGWPQFAQVGDFGMALTEPASTSDVPWKLRVGRDEDYGTGEACGKKTSADVRFGSIRVDFAMSALRPFTSR